MRIILILLILVLIKLNSYAQENGHEFEFEYLGNTLHGVLNIPDITPIKGIVIIVHGSGETNAIAENWHNDFRKTLNDAGYSTYMWDKMGCGKSEGAFDYNQTVFSSAEEVIAAIQTLKEQNIPGSETIGLWGISRAGWINPIVINKYDDIAFWISVSGVDERENFAYLLEQNIQIGNPRRSYAEKVVEELLNGYEITHSGGSFEDYMNATKTLREDVFYRRFTNNSRVSEEGYYSFQEWFMQESFDSSTKLQIYVDDFEIILSNVNVPVLALFGELDKNVDWKKTYNLYKDTLGPHGNLKTYSFRSCNHNLFESESGGFYELQDNNGPYILCEGVLETITEWLVELD